MADRLVCGDEMAVYGDRAYESKKRRQWLRSQGIEDCILHRSHKNQRGLPEWQQQRNAENGPVRALVEKVFGTLKRSYGYGRVRYCGLAAKRRRDVDETDSVQPEEGGGTDGIGQDTG